ncbi:MAG: sigma-70 family RNA polymerase sigma factor [Planctomycetes bacterium]|nr:sigma-70 family RNA polymerase sigma factor [Planctomycetota bacterium]
MTNLTWPEIVDTVVSGHPQGVSHILEAYGPDLVGYVRALAGDDSARFAMVLEDVLSDLLKQISASKSAKDPRRFVFDVATTTVRRHHQWVFREESSRRSKEQSIARLESIGEPNVDQIQAAIARLAPEERELLYLNLCQGFTLEDISDMCVISLSRLEDDLVGARQRFRYALLALGGATGASQ